MFVDVVLFETEMLDDRPLCNPRKASEMRVRC